MIDSHFRGLRSVTAATLALVVFMVLSFPLRAPADTNPLPQDTGYIGLYRTLQELRTTARLLHTTAHPDDEDGGMLTLEARGRGATVVLCTLTRGEGGQNKSGSAFSDELGLLRTLELLAADQYYGVEQRFTRVADFGYSKNANETIEKWGGHETVLRDLVRVIRTFRPDIIISRFQGTSADGHGNHEASGVLTKEAFRAAADPNRFPEQIKEGLLPWQAKKLYQGGLFRAGSDYTLRIDLGSYDPMLGASYAQFGLQGLAHQTSQGAGGARLSPGHRYGYYRLVDSVLPRSNAEPEKDFFDGIDTTLPALASRLGSEESKVPNLRPRLAEISRQVEVAVAALTPADPSRAAPALLKGLGVINGLIKDVESSNLGPAVKADLLASLHTKQRQFQNAVNLALGVVLDASVDAPGGNQPSYFPRLEQTFQMATPGQSFTLTAKLYNRSGQTVNPQSIDLMLPQGWQATPISSELKPLQKDNAATVQFKVTVPEDAQYTRPYWHRSDPYRESIEQIDWPQYQTLPLTPWPVTAKALFRIGDQDGEADSVAQVKYIDPFSGQGHRDLAVGPPFSVEMGGESYDIPASTSRPILLQVRVRSNVTTPTDSELHLELPAGWQSVPPVQPVHLQGENDWAQFQFSVRPAGLHEGQYPVRGTVNYQGKQYSDDLTLITRAELSAYYFYRPATQNVSAIQVNLPQKLKIGYIMGAGDEIPATLQQLGLEVETISPVALAAGDLSRYDTIVLGIRAYDVRDDVRAYNRRLLDFVAQGGTLIVQYNQSTGTFNAIHPMPYPATAGNERVSVEEAPVEILVPEDKIMKQPNQISQKDFDNWVQERGLYFMKDWDEHYTPLLSSHDPGEQPLKGGLLVAKYGKGTYVYTGYAFFRQLPAGVPGAVRLFVNLLAAGH